MNYVDLGCKKDTIDRIDVSTKLLSAEELFLFSKRIVKCRRWTWEKGMLLCSDVNKRSVMRLSEQSDWDAHVFCGGHPVLSDEETVCSIVKRIRLLRDDINWFPSSFYLIGEDYQPVWTIDRPSNKRQTYYSSCQEVLSVVYSKL